MSQRVYSEIQLVNGSTGDPVLYIDYPDRHNALLFDGGENAALPFEKLADLEAVMITHHHVDHFIGLDRIIRANIDADKTLSIFGPAGTIEKVYDRIKSYEYPFFPFQKIAVLVHDLLPGKIRRGLLECTRRFPPPEASEEAWSGPQIFANDEVTVEAVHADHTVPCLSYALVEKPGYHFDAARLAKGALRGGPWIEEVLRRLRSEQSAAKETLEIGGGIFSVKQLADQYFQKSRGARVAFIVDTLLTDQLLPSLTKLAYKAHRLYCDSFYAPRERKAADKHHHMTCLDAARLAAAAEVEQLILIHFSQRYRGRYEQLVEQARAVFAHTTAEL